MRTPARGDGLRSLPAPAATKAVSVVAVSIMRRSKKVTGEDAMLRVAELRGKCAYSDGYRRHLSVLSGSSTYASCLLPNLPCKSYFCPSFSTL